MLRKESGLDPGVGVGIPAGPSGPAAGVQLPGGGAFSSGSGLGASAQGRATVSFGAASARGLSSCSGRLAVSAPSLLFLVLIFPGRAGSARTGELSPRRVRGGKAA